jgi:hypothetical protein
MSATIYWQYITPQQHKTLAVSAPSSFVAAMERAFGGGPRWVLSGVNTQKLEGMAAAFGPDTYNPFLELLDIIGEDGHEVEVWTRY